MNGILDCLCTIPIKNGDRIALLCIVPKCNMHDVRFYQKTDYDNYGDHTLLDKLEN